MAWPQNTQSIPDDAKAGIELTEDFQRFAQRDDIFSRTLWDKRVGTDGAKSFFASYRMAAAPRRGEGFSQRDFALRNASWLISDIISERSAAEGRREGFQAAIAADTAISRDAVTVEDTSAMAAEIKRIAKFFGADLCGITAMDERWLYTSRVDARDGSPAPIELPDGMTSVIVLGHQMDAGLVDTYPSALAGAATGREYSHEAAIVMQLAAYIRNLGYEAVASMNDTGLVIPFALQAGLGEYARNQLVITPEFGPRLRFSKIFTKLPLAHDPPRKFGVASFCNICTKCADACPVNALPYGPPTTETPNRSAIKGVRKWTSDAEKCFGFWTRIASDCAICLRVCPFNRDYSNWYNRLWLRLALSPLRHLALWLAKKHGTRIKPSDWWARIE